MQSPFYFSVLSFLKTSTDLIIELNYKSNVGSPFHAVYFPEKKIAIHIIELDKEKLSLINPELFKLMSDDSEKHHIKTIHLWEDAWIKHNAIVRMRLQSQLGSGKKIHGRLTQVVTIDIKKADEFFNSFHLQQTTNANYRLGLLHGESLYAMATFSKARLMTYEKEHYQSYELIRFANKAGYSVVGGLSKLISAFMKEQNAVHLMTYADRDWSNGNGYRKLGFTKIENTAPQLFWIHPNDLIRYVEHRLPDDLIKEFNAQKKLSLEEFLMANGYLKIYNSGNTKYILDQRNKN